ncbi:MAG: hypothetical protein ACOH5I_17870 [Oligoflexus sp.]
MKKFMFLLVSAAFLMAGAAQARSSGNLSITPYVSIKNNKTIVPNVDTGEEEERIDERQEYGIRAALRMGKLFKFQMGLGQSKSIKTEKAARIKDTYDKIDLQQELNISTDDPSKDIKITETQNVGNASIVFDPSFSVFIARVKLGITAMQRIFEKEEEGLPSVRKEDGPNYFPHSGVGLGIKVTPRMFFIAEYEFIHYAYPPKAEPFERQLTVSFGLQI